MWQRQGDDESIMAWSNLPWWVMSGLWILGKLCPELQVLVLPSLCDGLLPFKYMSMALRVAENRFAAWVASACTAGTEITAYPPSKNSAVIPHLIKDLLFVKYICSLFTKALCHVDLKWVIRAAGVDIWHQKEINIRFRPVLNAFDISEQQFSSIMDWWTLTTNAHSLGKWENVSLEAALAATSFLNGFWWLDGQMFAESKWLCQTRTDSWRF